MNVRRLSQQLRREVKANPGKAALLGVLLAVALYYWIPLAGKWLSPASEVEAARAQPAASAGLVQTAEKPSPTLSGGPPTLRGTFSPSEKSSEAFPAWDQLVQQRQSDPRTQPVPWPPNRRNPFQPYEEENLSERNDQGGVLSAAQSARKGKTPSGSESQGLPEPPESLELELTSIVVGPDRRVALINGRPYQEGNTFVFTKDGQQWKFRLSRILPTGVFLEWNDRRYEVQLPRAPSNVEIQVDSSAKNEGP
ncbi:MAG TPA: hypothetical protein PK777_05840 [Thermoguttaceae bacterium]|nr:hypothetical protein [Thermoguttaceae bacterium]HPP52451.1 hypothetical protein [Thermoguttaceae bacterium]